MANLRQPLLPRPGQVLIAFTSFPCWAVVSMATGSSPREPSSPLAKEKQAPPRQRHPRLGFYTVLGKAPGSGISALLPSLSELR